MPSERHRFPQQADGSGGTNSHRNLKRMKVRAERRPARRASGWRRCGNLLGEVAMDRREMLKCAAALPIAMLPLWPQPELSRPPVNLHSTMDAEVWAREFVARFGGDEELMRGWFANAIMCGYDEAMRRRDREKPYDPAAVLEAIREAGVAPSVFSYQSGWIAQMYAERPVKSLGSVITSDSGSPFPDFASAVRWLHAQAAAADPEFAAKWPVPE